MQASLLDRLRAAGIRVRAVDGELEIDAPRGALTTELRDELAAQKPRLLKLLSWSRRAASATATPLAPADRSGKLPLSWAQQRLWFLDQLEPASSAYNISWTVRLRGQLDAPALRQAWQLLTERHESLRTVFPAATGVPEQRVLPAVGQVFDCHDLRGAVDERVRAHLQQLAAQSFDLAVGPLHRVALLQLAADEHILLVVVHHIVADGASMRIVFRELAALYDAELSGQAATLAPLPVQYADYAVWQRRWLDGDELSRQVEFWRAELQGLPPLLELPWDRPRSAAMRYRGASALQVLPADLTAELRRVSREHGCTLFMTMLAAFYVLLWRYSGRDDLVVGTPMGGRSRTSLEGLVGFFVNTVVLRARLDGVPDFASLLQQVRETALAAHANQDLPFEKLVEELQPQRELSYSPVFQVMFDLQEEPRWKLPVRNLEVIPEVVFSSRTSSFDLTLSVRQAESGLDAMFEYDTDLFDAATIERMAQHYQTLLEGIVLDSRQALDALPLVDAAAEQQLVRHWHSAAAPYPEALTLYVAAAAAAERDPAGIAIEHAGQCWSYGELLAYAEGVAAALAVAVPAADRPVAVLARRTPETIGAMLGILQAGRAVVPLDPAYPADRLRFMLRDAGAAMLLHMSADGALAETLQSPAVLAAPLPLRGAAPVGAPAPECAAGPASLAFIMYTSGTSGQPKGVELEHRGLVNYVSQLGQQTGLSSADRLLQFASFSFDIALEEVFAALLHGATLVLREDAMTYSLQEFVAGCEAAAITWMSLPTAWWHELCAGLQRGEVACPGALRCLVIGGEKAELDALRIWRAAAAQVRVINTYGPTEACIAAAWCELTYLDPGGLADVPIGQPVPNTQLWVMDQQQRLLPAGLPGEICIGGVGLARGYRGLPEQTASRFVTVALPDGTRERLYRTGDRGRYGNDGNLLFLGRSDAQIKLRGHRIEPAEIEAALIALPGVERCAVVPYGTGPATLLVAYVTGGGDSGPLRDEMRLRLPDYMVPAEFVMLPQLPFTANGKLDRAALPPPSGAGRDSNVYRPPGTATERALAAIWSAVLDVPRVGVDDDFFALGGHSLIATRVMARVREELGAAVPLRALFDAPTVARLAVRIDATTTTDTAAVPLVPRAQTPALLPLASAQRRLWVLDQLEPGNTAYNLYAAVRLEGSLSLPQLQGALDQLVARHESLRTVFAEHNGEPVQRIVAGRALALAPERLSAAAYAAVAERITELVNVPFDLATGPLLRLHVLQPADGGAQIESTVLVIVMHHIISDGWSMSVLCSDLSHYYNAAVLGSAPPASLQLQYPDYALWQQQCLRLPAFSAVEDYWREQLRDVLPLLELPLDHTRPPVQRYVGAWVSRLLPADLHNKLQAFAAGAGVSLFMVLLTAFKALLYRHTGRTDLLVGTPVAGRTQTALEPLIGCFLNTLVLRTRCGSNPTFKGLLAGVRETTLAAYEHQELPFERLLEMLQPPRNPAHTPIVQVLFNLHNERGAGLQLAGLSAEPLMLERAAAKFDLSVALAETAQGLQCGFEYNTDLFDAATVAQLMDHYGVLLRALLADAAQPIAGVSLAPQLPPAATVLADAVFVPAAYRSIGERFGEVVAQHAARPAVRLPERVVTYHELAARAGAVAAALQHAGARRGDVVGLLLGHDDEMLAGLLGTLLAGCAYVPLDRSLPAARIRRLLDKAEVVRVLHGADFAGAAAEVMAGAAGLVPMPAHSAAGAAAVAAEPAGAAADQLAYILFTSGSTGEPKGVLQSHGNVLRHAATYAAALRVSPTDVLTLLPGYSFDAAVMDIFAALLSGAALQPVDLLQVPVPGDARQQLAGATVWHCTPTVLRHLLGDRVAGEPLPDARALVLGGEVARSDDFDLFKRHFAPGAVFVNGYGPSESTLAAQFFATHDTPLPGRAVPMGVPVAHTEIVLLEGDAPAGVSGEIVIRSSQLSLGYLGAAAATAARFSRPEPGSAIRQYRTGDRARRLPDGQLVYLGRRDGQVKLRGYRIEPGEIEAWVSAVPDVERCAVILRDAQLICFYSGAAAVSAIRRQLLANLPNYMLPHSYARLDALPLRPNGKIARDTLAGLAVMPSAEERTVAPQGELEAQLAAIWCSVLGRAEIGRHDDFFALGGHSLLATQVIARLRDQGFSVSLGELFGAPTLAELAATMGPAGEPHEVVPLRRRDSGRLPPLSWAQQRLWFLAQLEPESAAYHLHWAGRLAGLPDPELLGRALRAVGERHESLRTCIQNHPDGPVQIVSPVVDLTLERISLPGAGDAVIQSRLRELIRRPFDLGRPPLLRAYLLEQGAADAVLLLVMHHIVSDGWSMGVLFRELSEVYTALDAGRAPLLPELPLQYADYAVWQQRWLRGAELERQTRYWRQRLADAPPLLALPLDYPRPPVQRDRGAWLSRRLPAALLERCRGVAAEQGVTLFMVLLAAFKALLFRYTGQRDVLVGAPVAGRPRTELEGLIGYFLNMLVLRTAVEGDRGFGQLLQAVRATTVAAYDHQDLPFEKLLEICNPARSVAHTPLVQVSFNLHNEPGGSLRLADIATEVLTLDRGTAKFDLSMAVVETRGGLQTGIEYNTDLFTAATVRQMLLHYEELLAAGLSDSAGALAAIALTPAAPDLRLPQVGPLFAEVCSGATVVQRFDAIVALHAQRRAVCAAGKVTSYAALQARSQAIAHALAEQELPRGACVGVLLGHDADMVAALLGVMRAGCAYVPLDPAAPLPRLRQAVTAAEPAALLAASGYEEVGQALTSAGDPLLCLTNIATAATHGPVDLAAADELAYVLFTSGSTGKPKGVMQSHRNVLHHVGVYADALQIKPGDRLTLFSAFGFDAAVMDIFGALLTGACLYPLDIRAEDYPGQTLDLISTEQLTLLHATPTVYRYLMRSRVCRHELDTVRAVVLGGERATAADFDLFRKQFATGAVFVNGLGPSESTLTAQFFANHDTQLPGGQVPIGKAVRATELVLLDAAGQPTGLEGELAIRSAFVARGYWRQPALSVQRFSAVAAHPGEYLYRTGDRVRRLPCGNLVFIGRNDDQLKVRGHRIEAGDIEAALTELPGVQRAAVMLRDAAAATPSQLVAYVVGGADATAVRSKLREVLPQYMVPDAVVLLEALPLLANGKLDRTALPEPRIDLAAGDGFVAARTETERHLAGLWADVLGLSAVGIHDDFFEIGGHSLLAAQLAGRIHTSMQVVIPLRRLFDTPTVAQLADYIDTLRWAVEAGDRP